MSDKTSKTKKRKEPTAEVPSIKDAFPLDDFESGYTSEKKLLLEDETQASPKALVNPPPLPTATSSSSSDEELETLKRYLSHKESELKDLQGQQKHYQEYLQQLSAQVEEFAQQNRELLNDVESQRRTNNLLSQEIEKQKQAFEDQCTLLKNDYEGKLAQAAHLTQELQALTHQKEEFKEKVREDLKRIKLKERELENKYELLKRDSQTLLDSKDQHILELRKKNDALDLELETLDEKLRQASATLNGVSVKKKRLIETMKLAISLLEEIDSENLPGPEHRKAG